MSLDVWVPRELQGSVGVLQEVNIMDRYAAEKHLQLASFWSHFLGWIPTVGVGKSAGVIHTG